MGFIENLRMQSLFSPGIAPPRRYVDEPRESGIDREALQRMIRETLLSSTGRPKINEIAPINRTTGGMRIDDSQPQNVVYKESITPFQRESLALRDRGLDINELRTRGNLELGQDRIDLGADRNRIQDERTAIQKQRADIYAFKAKNPNLRFDFTGPTVKIANPLTGEIEDTGIATGNLTDADRIALGQTNALERLNLTNDFRRQFESVRQGNALERQSHAADLQLNEVNVRDRLKDDKPQAPTQARARSNATFLLNKYPDWMPKHIKFRPDGTFTVEQNGLDDKKYADLLDQIYGTKSTNPNEPTNPNRQVETPNPDDAKRNQAIEILRQNGKPVTENNIKFVLGQIK